MVFDDSKKKEKKKPLREKERKKVYLKEMGKFFILLFRNLI